MPSHSRSSSYGNSPCIAGSMLGITRLGVRRAGSACRPTASHDREQSVRPLARFEVSRAARSGYRAVAMSGWSVVVAVAVWKATRDALRAGVTLTTSHPCRESRPRFASSLPP